MTKSPFIIASALIFWSWQTGLWWLGLPLAILAELPRFLNGYWELNLKERQRVADICSITVVLTLVYIYITQPPLGNAVILTTQWSPIIFFPLFAMQIYGGLSGIELSVLFSSLRGNRTGGNELIDLRPIYLIVCLLGAAMLPPSNDVSYYQGLGFITLWALWPLRRPNRIPFIWVLNFFIAIIMGFSIGIGLNVLQAELEEYIIVWLSGIYRDNTDPYRTITAIGDMGRLKLSERVMVRVWPDTPLLLGPLLLRSASFTSYAGGVWVAPRVTFNPLIYNMQGWNLWDGKPSTDWVQITVELNQGSGILPLPNGSQLLQGLKGAQLTRNDFGTVKVAEGPSFANYRVNYDALFTERPPQDIDLRVPVVERPILEKIVNTLNLKTIYPNQALDRVQSLFQQKFIPSLHLPAIPAKQSPLTHFLTESRTGHCEYFASAAVLLLRQAGIPARYVHGWSVQEYSELEQAYIARASHAHAWALVWINGAWQDFDPTPASWIEIEANKRSWWREIQDVWEWMRYRLYQQHEAGKTNNVWLIIILIILISLLIWRIARRGKHVIHIRNTIIQNIAIETIFTPIESVLSVRTRPRYKGETLRNWLNSLLAQGEPGVAELLLLLNLYYRQRFDPLGLNLEDKKNLHNGVEKWLHNF